jgi:hypothetical protein
MSWSNRLLALEALSMLAAARMLIKITPERDLVSRMGNILPAPESSVDGERAGSRGNAALIGATVEHVARATFWRSMCLEKALAGKWMLRRRGIPSTMFVGMARDGDGFVAHAWLVGEGQTVTGGGQTTYATLAAFHESGS